MSAKQDLDSAIRTSAELPHWLVISLHFVPNAAITVFYLLTAPVALRSGFPRDLALLTGFMAVGIPVQLAILATVSRRTGHSVVRYRERLPPWQYLVSVLALLVVAGALLLVPL